MAQQVFGRQAPAAPQAAQRVQHIVEPQQRRCPPAPAHRRLVDRGGEAPRGHRGEYADEARPGDVQELPGCPALAPHLDEAAETGKRPVERAPETRPLRCLVRQRRAAEEIGAVQEPDARLLQGAADAVDLDGVDGPCPHHPGAYDRIGDASQHSPQREPAETGVANRQGLRLPLAHMAVGSAVPCIDQVDRLHM